MLSCCIDVCDYLKVYPFAFCFSFKESDRMHADKEEEALINEEAILNIVENSQSFHHLSQRLSQTAVFSEYNWNVFSSGLFYCSTVFIVLSYPASCERKYFISQNLSSKVKLHLCHHKASYFLIMSPVQCISRSYCVLLVR